jgi:serine/threonine protein kinase
MSDYKRVGTDLHQQGSAPTRIGKYEIIGQIGRGGMSTVHRARMLGPGHATKQVALKLIHQHLSRNEAFARMFLDEIRVAMAMTHRNIVQTFDASQSDGMQYMVMELVEGCSVRQLLALHKSDGVRLPMDIAAFIAAEVSAALDYAHSVVPDGVVHRDLSPGNILLSSQGDVKLADFGVAKAAGRLTVTVGDLFKGKLRYTAPEQARGNAEAASDVFSLAVVLFEMIAGQPFRSGATLDQAREYRGLPRALADLVPAVPPALSALVSRCLSPEPPERPAAGELTTLLRDEHIRLQRDLPQVVSDPRLRLQNCLDRFGPAHDEQAAKLARAMMEQVVQIPTDPALRSKNRPGPPAFTPPMAYRPDCDEAPAKSPDPVHGKSPRTSALVIAAVVLFVAAGMVAGWALFWKGAPRIKQSRQGQPARLTQKVDGHQALDAARVATSPDEKPAQDLGHDSKKTVSRPVVRHGARVLPRAASRSRNGRLDLNTDPWTTVFIDDKPRGQTPIQGLILSVGIHRLRLVNTEEGISRTVNIRIRANQTTRKVLVLNK